jgi:exoribonuclease-2
MGPGEYVVEKPGENQEHFGLAVHDYTHATAPNRRFVDLVTQRILKAQDGPPYSHEELAHIGAHCTEREHAAQKVERTMRKVGAALFMQKRIGETFDGIVTGVTKSGTFVRLVTPPAEGRVVRGEQSLDVGDKVRVKLVATEPSRGFIDFARA